MPSARAREPQARPRRVLISLYFVSLEYVCRGERYNKTTNVYTSTTVAMPVGRHTKMEVVEKRVRTKPRTRPPGSSAAAARGARVDSTSIRPNRQV